MTMLRTVLTVILIGKALCYITPSSKSPRAMVALCAKSKSVPFLSQPAALTGNFFAASKRDSSYQNCDGITNLASLDNHLNNSVEQNIDQTGKLPGDVGFDPIGFTDMWADKDWSQQIVPDNWLEASERTPITTLEWMREAELKHGRLSMLAFLGWVAVDSGLRLPGLGYESIPSSFVAHDAAVANGSMGFLLFVVGILELTSGAAIFDQAKGSGRASGDFSFDPLNLGLDKNKRERYAVSEIKNGRLAMLAISGILTQQAAFPDLKFPFI